MSMAFESHLEQKAWSILKTKDRLQGVPYLKSQLKLEVDAKMRKVIGPVARVATCLGKWALATFDGTKEPIYMHKIMEPNGTMYYAEKLRTLLPNAAELEKQAGLTRDELKQNEKGVHRYATKPVGRILRISGFDETAHYHKVLTTGIRMRSEDDMKNKILLNEKNDPHKTWLRIMRENNLGYAWLGLNTFIARNASLEVQADIDLYYINHASKTGDWNMFKGLFTLFFKATGK